MSTTQTISVHRASGKAAAHQAAGLLSLIGDMKNS